MEPTQPQDRPGHEHRGAAILATLSRIADESRDRDRRALAAATARGIRLAQARADGQKLPWVA
jgi:hypothetical protein